MGVQLEPQEESSQFVDDRPFEALEVEESHRTLKNDDIELRCLCSSTHGRFGRNLVVCIDGTANQFSTQNTNVVELYSRLVKSDDQLTYYNSGIGTYVKDSNSWLSFKAWKQSFHHNIDKGFATNFKSKVLGGYQWLSENYRPGDRIFLFGFSRGAYQVRVIAGMIEKVGLLHKGNNEQIAFAYDLYTQTIATKNPEELAEPEELCKRFKHTLSHRKARTHFVGAWDTVSAIGVFRGPNLPETTTGMKHVCAFRHALALDELRVKFLPEYANGGAGPKYQKNEVGSQNGDVKEMWFAGSHSDIGGGNVANIQLDHFGPSLRWMSYEAIKRGLKIEPHQSPWESLKPESSMNWFYGMLEYFPISRLSYAGPENVLSWPPPRQTPRKILPGQMIHESVFDLHLKKLNYKPIARFHDDAHIWDEQLLREQGLIEDDPYIRADHVLGALDKSNQKMNRLSDEHLDALVALSATPIGRQSITEFSGSGDILVTALELECQRLEKTQRSEEDTFLIVCLAKALNSFDTIPSQPNSNFNAALWSVLSELYPKSSSEWFKFYDRFGPESSACAIFIGIDKYQSQELSLLHGCVADANDLASAFMQFLGLSSGQVSVITDSRATRATIIRTISNLATNRRIARDDPIIVFFAGHSSLDNEKMASIVPYDYPQSEVISSDILNDLIAEVAEAKGNNITLLLDCAYAGAFGSHSYTDPNAASRVLLAGCGKAEFSQEVSKRGWFSSNLSKILREAKPTGSYTYQDIVKRFPDGRQTPQCIGRHIDRFFCNIRRSAAAISYRVMRKRPAPSTNDSPEELIVSVGELHGITQGAILKIQAQHPLEGETELPSFLAVVDTSRPHHSTIHCTPQEIKTLLGLTDPDNADSDDSSGQGVIGTASLICGGVGSELSVAVTTDTSLLSRALVEEIANQEFETFRLKFVGWDTPHQLRMSVREGKVAFDVVDGRTQKRIPIQFCDGESLLSALEHAAYFFWHLGRTSDSPSPKNLLEQVTVEVWELGAVDGRYTSASSPIGENLFQGGAIRIPAQEDDREVKFAFKMTNTTSFNLYVWVFAFDPEDLNIETIYKPPIVKGEGDSISGDPCLLRSGGHLLFSNVSNTIRLCDFTAGSDEFEGIAYLKVFLSSQYTDFSLVEGNSPFDRQHFTTTPWGQEWSPEFPGDIYDPFVVEGTATTLRLRGGAMRPFKARVPTFWNSFIIPIHRNRTTAVEVGDSFGGCR